MAGEQTALIQSNSVSRALVPEEIDVLIHKPAPNNKKIEVVYDLSELLHTANVDKSGQSIEFECAFQDFVIKELKKNGVGKE